MFKIIYIFFNFNNFILSSHVVENEIIKSKNKKKEKMVSTYSMQDSVSNYTQSFWSKVKKKFCYCCIKTKINPLLIDKNTNEKL